MCYKYIYSTKAELSPAYLILIVATFSPTVVSFLLFSGRSLFKIKKLVKYLPKLYLFTTWFNIALPNFIGVSTKSASCS